MFDLDEFRFLLVVIAIILTIIWLKSGWSRFGTPPLPPGPWRFPILGSVSIIPSATSLTKRHQLRVDLAKKYGKIVSFQIGSLNIVMLNDKSTIEEAFLTKADVLSDRTAEDAKFTGFPGQMANYVGLGIAEANYGPAFLERKSLIRRSMKDLDEKFAQEAGMLIEELRKEATKNAAEKKATDVHHRLIPMAVTNFTGRVFYGRRMEYSDPTLGSLVDAVFVLFRGTKSAAVEKIPFARFLPAVRRLKERETKAGDFLLDFAEKEIQAHKANFHPENDPKDFIDICLQEAHLKASSTVGEENIKKSMVDHLFAGNDTLGSPVLWFILHMIHYPDIQRRCQEEIDRWFHDGEIEGDHQLTKDAIVESLPYTTATLMEILRMVGPAGASIPHFAREDVTVAGYHVPKGSMVMANIRFMHMDEKNWVRPNDFDPTRWFDSRVKGASKPELIHHSAYIPYGVGKRICTGKNIAKVGFLVLGVSLVRNFWFEAEKGKELPTLVGFGPFAYTPRPFKVVLNPRH